MRRLVVFIFSLGSEVWGKRFVLGLDLFGGFAMLEVSSKKA